MCIDNDIPLPIYMIVDYNVQFVIHYSPRALETVRGGNRIRREWA